MIPIKFQLANGMLKDYIPQYTQYFHGLDDPSDPMSDLQLLAPEFPLRNAFHSLCQLLGYLPSPDVEQRPKKAKITGQPVEDPFVVLAFDEIYTLSEEQKDGETSWSHFGELRRTIRGLKHASVFTLFLSTSGTLFSITPPPGCDISARMAKDGDVMLPFCELGFDQLATRLNFSEPIELSHVTSLSYFTSIGQPLCVPKVHLFHTY